MTVTDPTAATHTFVYDAAGDLTSVTDPEGGIRSYGYSRHRLTTVTDENGNVEVTNTYDDDHRVVTQTDAAGKVLTLAYETPGKGATGRRTPRAGTPRTTSTSTSGRRTRWIRSGRVIGYLYDANGNLDKVIDPALDEWEFVFNASADLTSTTDPLGNPVSFTYNPKHLPTTITDARGNVTTMTYDGRATSRRSRTRLGMRRPTRMTPPAIG